MFFGKMRRLASRLSFRLTLWYAGIFILTSTVAFVFFYLFIISVTRERTDQELNQKIGQFAVMLSIQGVDELKRAAILESQAAGEKKLFIRLLYPTGVVFSSTNMSYWRDIDVDRSAVQQLLDGNDPVFQTISIDDRKNKVRVAYSIIGQDLLLQVGYSMEADTRIIEAFKRTFISTMAMLMITSALIGWFLARRALVGVERVTQTAGEITEEQLEKRVPTTGRGDEVDRLAVTFNRMLDRIQKLVAGTMEMNDNIAHDLKSPITRIRGLAEITLTGDGSIESFRRMAGDTVEQCDRLLDMVNTMLVISEAEAGVGKMTMEIIDIQALIHNACELFSPIAEDKGLKLECSSGEPCRIKGDRPMVQRVIANLLDNAIKYTPAPGRVEVMVDAGSANGEPLKIHIIDTGIGIPASDHQLIFKRFFRCDQSRSRPGNGLGLSLAKAVVLVHGGNISVESSRGKGSRFTISIPKFISASKSSDSNQPLSL
ncbi:MAG: HAMP domain-containing protein [Desulfobacteraceae bacterium]|nr:HAMP domain-containing protein [Desulfobacteraceae bacterium]